jgi:excisionase family DNA binding protein
MAETAIIVQDDTVYTPDEIAAFAKCSPSLVRKEMQRGRLKGHRLGGRLLRAKGREVHAWLERQSSSMERTVSEGSNPESAGVSNGTTVTSVPDTASILASIALRERQRPL